MLHQAREICQTETRPWGSFKVLEVDHSFKVKQITVNSGGTLSLQSHQHRSEHWVVVSGVAEVTLDDSIEILEANESIYIPQGAKHRIVNREKFPLVIIETQLGTYFGEDDIIRYEDVYGRCRLEA